MSKKRSGSTSSDRWSKASSDSDVSFISNPSELRLDRTRASDVKDLLDTLAQFTGGRDKQGYLIITVLHDATLEDASVDDLRKVVLYLTEATSPEEQEEGFSFLVLLKPVPPYGTIRPLLKVLQEYFPFKVFQVYVLKPDGYKEKLLASSLTCSKFVFTIVTKDNLAKYIAPSDLTIEFNGSLNYDHSAWFKMRLAFEKFLFESMALSTKLDEIKRSLLQDGISTTVDGAREQMQHHQYVKKWIIKAPIEVLADEAKKVINTIKTSCDCQSEDDLKDEYKNSMHQVRGMIGTLQDQRTMLKDLWVNRRGQLEQRYQFNVFMEDAEKMLAWIMENRQEFMSNFSEIGEELEMAKELREEHKQFEETCGDVQVNIDRILQVANRLREMQNYDTELVDRLASKVESEWNKLYTAVERRSTMLEASVSFHKSSEHYSAQSKVWMEEMGMIEKKDIDTQETYDEAMRTNEALKQSMSESYEIVNTDSKHLLNCLQRAPSGDSREEKARSRLSDYTDAASHVMDVIVVLYEQNKQLMIMWEKQKVRISQKYQLSIYGQECSELLKYIQVNGNSFLVRNSWVGDQVDIAEELLTEHRQFETKFQDTYFKTKKLLDTANHLADSKECDPAEIQLKQTYLESEMKTFTSKLKKRRQLLKMAVSFFRNAQELSLLSEKLKNELNLDGVGVAEGSQVDAQLEDHRHECESTLERLLCTVHEGEQLSFELSEECKTDAGKDSRTSWYSAGSNSIEQSRLAVELYLKELNHNRQQLEKIWQGRQKKLENWIQVKHYTRDFNIICSDAMKWNAVWLEKELSVDMNKALSMVERFEKEFHELSERFQSMLGEGRDLEISLCNCGVEVIITSGDNVKEDSIKYVNDIIKKLQDTYENIDTVHHKLKIKYEFTIKQRKLETEAKKVSGWIRHGESILQASQEAVFSMYEAEALLREYERFHVAIETTRIGVIDIRENASKIIHEGHPDYKSINIVAQDVEDKWKQLMHHAEERRAVVFSSYNFYRAAEQVSKLLEKFSKDCVCDGDPCEKFEDYELKFKREKIESLIKKSEPERKAVEDGCLKVKECSVEFLKRVLPAGDGYVIPVFDGPIGRLEITVNDLVEQVTSQETFVLKQIHLRKTILIGCAEYILFHESAQETLELITTQHTILSERFKAIEHRKGGCIETEDKNSYLQTQEEDKAMFSKISEKVKLLLREASDLVLQNHYHRNNVNELAMSLDRRYKLLSRNMKDYREALSSKLDCSIPSFEANGDGWPTLTALQIQASAISDVVSPDVSSDGMHEVTEKKRQSAKRTEFIINELIQTEKTYVDDLKCCIENFLIPMYNSPDVPDALRGFEGVIFGNIEMIHEFHSNIFLGELTKYEKCADNVGKCFAEWADKFHMYVDFCANKPASNALLIKHGETFFEDLQLKRGLGLSIAAYLIKPVQRITKYQLLLKELISCCSDKDGTLQAGLEVMLSVPQRANDAMYLCMIKGFDDGSLETLGKILLQDSFIVSDPKHILKKGKERHLFLFEQALLLCKEMKDANGKCTFEYKCKLKTSEMGITEHVAEDKCKFAVWTGNPPLTEEKRIIKAESEVVKNTWVKEIRELIQQFQFGILKARTNFYPTSPRRKNTRISLSQVDTSINSDSTTFNVDNISAEYDTATICSRNSLENCSHVDAMYISTDEYLAKDVNEVSLQKGQNVEVLSKPPGSRSWRVRILDLDLDQEVEGFVPSQLLRKKEESLMHGKRSSVETLNSQSSEDSYQTESPKGSMQSVDSGKTSPKSIRRHVKSSNISGTITKQRKTWSRASAKKHSIGEKPSLPTTPTRNKSISGGGSKKLQALLGAPESDIDLLIRPSDGKFATFGRSMSSDVDKVKVKVVNEYEETESLEGNSMNDSIENSDTVVNKDMLDVVFAKRTKVLRELIESEKEYVNELEMLLTKFIPAMNDHTNIPEELKGKEKVILGNIRDLFSFHQEFFVYEISKCEELPDTIASVFLESEKKFELYIMYCANMPRSASLIHDYLETFFADVSSRLEQATRIEEYLMKPVQRIMKYFIMLKDFTKYTGRAGIDTSELTKALHVMQSVPKRADDIMNVGMLEGFTENLNNQGKLLMQDMLCVADVKMQGPSLEHKVFLFEKLLIFAEPLERKSNLLCYIFRHSIATHTLGLTANYDNELTEFTLWSKRDSGSSEIYHITARSPAMKKAWIDAIKKITEEQYFKARSTPTSTDAGLQNVKLTSLSEAKCIEPMNLFPGQDKYIVTENYQAQCSDELTVQKNDIVCLINQVKKDYRFYVVRNLATEKSGSVPSSILRKSNDRKPSDDKSKVRRSYSVEEKPRKESSKVSKIHISGSLLRTTSLKRRKDRNKRKVLADDDTSTNTSPTKATPKSVLGKLHQHWASNFDSSDDDDDESKEASSKADRSLGCNLLSEEDSITSEAIPRFKTLLRDVTVDVGSNLKLTCAVVAHPPPEIVWSKDKCELSKQHESERCRITNTSELVMFEVFSAEHSDSGTYSCAATNSFGSTMCSCRVTVQEKCKSGASVQEKCKPGAPSKPIVLATTDNSITLRWNPPASNQNVPVDGYSVQYREDNSPNWHIKIPLCELPTASIDDLKTGCKYAFRVSANSKNGTSENSEPSDLIQVGEQKGDEDNIDSSRPNEIHWQENMEDNYSICSELGRGRFSIVKRCVEKRSNKEFAAKIIRRGMLSKEAVESEVAILQALYHRSIVSVHEIYDIPKGLVIVEQLLAGGRLFDHIVLMDMLTEEVAIQYIKQLLLALQYIHKKNIAHLDIKPENILLAVDNERPCVVLSDFGEAIRLGSVPYQHELTGIPEFSAPEIISNDTVSLATDMWSVGVIVYVLLSGVSPFYSDNIEHARANVTEISYKFPDEFFSHISDEAQDFIEELLIRDQAHRPDAEECLQFAWIRMGEAENKPLVRKNRINLVYLAAFNARRRYQYESFNRNPSASTTQLLSREGKSSLSSHHR